MPSLTIRLTDADDVALGALCDEWRANRTAVVRRLLNDAYTEVGLRREAGKDFLRGLVGRHGADAILSVTVDGASVVEARLGEEEMRAEVVGTTRSLDVLLVDPESGAEVVVATVGATRAEITYQVTVAELLAACPS